MKGALCPSNAIFLSSVSIKHVWQSKYLLLSGYVYNVVIVKNFQMRWSKQLGF